MQTELAKFDSLRSKITTLLGPLKDLTVRDKVEHTVASGSLVTVKGLGKEIEALRVAAVSPLRDQVNAINTRAKELLAPIDEAEAMIKGRMIAFANAERARIEEDRRRIEEDLAAQRRKDEAARAAAERAEQERKRAELAFGAHDAEAVAAAEQRRKDREAENRAKENAIALALRAEEKRLAAQDVGGTRTVWKFSVTERLEVPMDYWEINEAKLGAAVRSGVREIPGVKIWSEQVVVAR